MQARLAKRPGVLDRRPETVEHPFGTIKQWMNQGAFLMRGLEKVRGEFSLTALADGCGGGLKGFHLCDFVGPIGRIDQNHDANRACCQIACEGHCDPVAQFRQPSSSAKASFRTVCMINARRRAAV
jgi:hypothetical protein